MENVDLSNAQILKSAMLLFFKHGVFVKVLNDPVKCIFFRFVFP